MAFSFALVKNGFYGEVKCCDNDKVENGGANNDPGNRPPYLRFKIGNDYNKVFKRHQALKV